MSRTRTELKNILNNLETTMNSIRKESEGLQAKFHRIKRRLEEEEEYSSSDSEFDSSESESETDYSDSESDSD